MTNRGGQREIRTWREGEVGMAGTRRIQPDGYIDVCGYRYYADALAEHVGQIVYFHDDDGEVSYGSGEPLRSVAIGWPYWHFNGKVSMTTTPPRGFPFLHRAWMQENKCYKVARKRK